MTAGSAGAAIVLRRSVPVGLVAGCGAVVVALVVAAAWRPATMWPLHGVALALVLGASAWCCDESLAPLVDVAPRARPFATRVRAGGPAVLVVVWALVHLVERDLLPPHLEVLVGQGVAAALIGFAIGSRARSLGEAAGGARAAMVVVPVLVGWALARPWEDVLPVFPVWPWERWSRAALLWGVAAAASAGSLVLASRPSKVARARRSRVASAP